MSWYSDNICYSVWKKFQFSSTFHVNIIGKKINKYSERFVRRNDLKLISTLYSTIQLSIWKKVQQRNSRRFKAFKIYTENPYWEGKPCTQWAPKLYDLKILCQWQLQFSKALLSWNMMSKSYLTLTLLICYETSTYLNQIVTCH